MKGSFFLNHESIPIDIEAAYMICIALQEEGKLKVSYKQNNNEIFVTWELKEND